AALGGCGGSSDSEADPPQSQRAGALPADPKEWACQDTPSTQEEIDAWCASHANRGRPVPEKIRNPPPLSDFVKYQTYIQDLKTFLVDREYEGLGWIADERWRFSGPSVLPPDNVTYNYGPHFPLRAYYSPEAVDWLCNGRQGTLPDGAMMIKAMTILFDYLNVDIA